ncbi:MAG: hypothetical protein UR68_C0035G0014 [Candidatus Roizmanbacteria bacterium GW2011_GWA2_35_19]|uniref:NadR/Ttd14 AAA domain-containing protein n=2 Tax=Candidatus Roizmaniibacteriota TaxID=1752723 RepID=A0A0G0BPP4_9BACT|nr:MAG: hypothetical protein UR63_C0037G0012 [Candidatus Roizmanbacteria bacterium GW2011_GWC2_35_12]KKP71489.1 MAG: hypothetical protein UR68_C0035G0014 [Candidatus Roizmanbacteria bacterium GW2011_GWA2_35_19]
MSHLIVISGPQSSGKTTVFNYLKGRLKDFSFVEEINPYIVKKSSHPRYISPSGKFQEELSLMTLKKIKLLNSNKNYVFETGPMQIVYVEKYSGFKAANLYLKKYLKILKSFNPTIIFIDSKPEISFKRRKKKYLERIKEYRLEDKEKEILGEYKQKIIDLYPLWLKWLDRYPYKKIVINNNNKTKRQFIDEVSKIILSLLSQKSS